MGQEYLPRPPRDRVGVTPRPWRSASAAWPRRCSACWPTTRASPPSCGRSRLLPLPGLAIARHAPADAPGAATRVAYGCIMQPERTADVHLGRSAGRRGGREPAQRPSRRSRRSRPASSRPPPIGPACSTSRSTHVRARPRDLRPRARGVDVQPFGGPFTAASPRPCWTPRSAARSTPVLDAGVRYTTSDLPRPLRPRDGGADTGAGAGRLPRGARGAAGWPPAEGKLYAEADETLVRARHDELF